MDVQNISYLDSTIQNISNCGQIENATKKEGYLINGPCNSFINGKKYKNLNSTRCYFLCSEDKICRIIIRAIPEVKKQCFQNVNLKYQRIK